MPSSLAAQLTAIKSHNADRLSSSKTASHSKSLSYLFPPEIASAQDLYMLHGLGSNGWEELSNIDPSIAKWGQESGVASILFGDGSRDLDRLTKDKEENARIDNGISDFFLILGDNLLERSAAKCIEWLVRRFRIHEYNVETTLGAFMPFHETQEFARMLQILNIDGKQHLAFLVPLKRKGVLLPSSILTESLLSNPSTTSSIATLRWVIQLLQNGKVEPHFPRPQNQVAQSFWLTCIVNITNRWSGEGDERQKMGLNRTHGKQRDVRGDHAQLLLNVLLPSTVHLITSPNSSADEQVIGCMGLSAIARSFNLSEEAAKSLLSSLGQSPSHITRARVGILATCASICAYQVGGNRKNQSRRLLVSLMTSETAANLTEKIAMGGSAMRRASKVCDVEAFALQLVDGIIDNNLTQEAYVAKAIGAIFESDSTLSKNTASRIIAMLMAESRSDLSNDLVDELAGLRQRRPEVFDAASALLTSNSTKVQRNLFEKSLWSIATKGMGTDKGTAMWLVSNDTASSSHIVGLKKMLESVQIGEVSVEDSLAQQTFLSAIKNDDPDNLLILYQAREILLQCVGIENLAKTIVNIIKFSISAESDNKVCLPSESLRLYLRLLLGITSSSELRRDVQDLIWRNALWPLLFCTKSGQNYNQAVYQELVALRDRNQASTGVLYEKIIGLVNSVEKQIQLGQWEQLNGALVISLAESLKDSDDATFSNDTEFIYGEAFKVSGAKFSHPGHFLAKLVLSEFLVHGKGDRQINVMSRILNNLEQDKLLFSSYSIDEAYLKTPRSSTYQALYTRPSSSVSSFMLSTLLLYSLAHNVPLHESKNLGAKTPTTLIAIRIFAIATDVSVATSQVGFLLYEKLLRRLGSSSLLFLVSIWTSSLSAEGVAPNVALFALRLAHQYFSSFQHQDKSTSVPLIDFQTVVPSLFLALKIGEKRIRIKALECLEAIRVTTHFIERNEEPGQNVQVYGYDSIYGSVTADHLRYLDSQEQTQMLTMILSHRESFENDPFYANYWVNSLITSNRHDNKREASFKLSVLQYFISHAMCWQDNRARILILEAFEDVSHSSKLEMLAPLLQILVSKSHINEEEKELLRLLFKAYDKSSKQVLNHNTKNVWSLLVQAVEKGSFTAQICAALAIKNHVFAILKPDKQRDLFSRIANMVAVSGVALPSELRSTLISLNVDVTILVPMLADLRNVISTTSLDGHAAKKAKKEVNDIDALSQASAVMVEMLEGLLSRKPLVDAKLVVELFDILRIGTEMLFSKLSSAEYLMQVSMSNLINIFDNPNAPILADNVENLCVDTVVGVIKTPCQPQTFQQSLLLLSSLAKFSPEHVLHHSMPIFTFVGSTMLQRDDEFSFTVIEKTLNSILPAFAMNLRKKTQATNARLKIFQEARELLCVFTDAATHIPRHRRSSFFHLLVQALGPEDFLAPICMLLVDRQASKVYRQQDNSDIQNILQLPLTLYKRNNSEASIQMQALLDVWMEIERSWNHRKDDVLEMQEHVFLDCVRGINSEHESGKVDPFKRVIALINFATIAMSTSQESFEDARIDENEEEILAQNARIVGILQRILPFCHAEDANLISAAQVALEEALSFTSSSTLQHVVSSMVSSSELGQRRTGLNIVCKSIEPMISTERERASKYTPVVIETCYTMLCGQIREDQILALNTLSSISSGSVSAEMPALARGIPNILEHANSDDTHIGSLSLEVLLHLSQHLATRLIPYVADIVGVCRTTLQASKENVHVSQCFNILSALVNAVPSFMTSYLPSIFDVLAARVSVAKTEASKRLISAIVQTIHSSEILQSLFSLVERNGQHTLAIYDFSLNIIGRCLKALDRKKVMAQYKSIFRFLIQIMDTRRKAADTNNSQFTLLSKQDISKIEDVAVDVFLKLVMKLNESSFRPLFLRLCDWALLDLEDEGARQARNDIQCRQVVLYKTINALLSQLGELVTHYYSNVLDSTIECLDLLASECVESDVLWSPVVESVKICARSDKAVFWNQARVIKILPVLATQIHTPVVQKSTSCQALLAEAMSCLCQTVSDEACFKEANYALLRLSRESTDAKYALPFEGHQVTSSESRNTRTRIIAIRTLERVWRTKGSDDLLLNLVPETVPVIAELLQESDAGIQQAMSGLVAAIEDILGEGLDAYLQ